jgi:hypothetical protein
MLLFSNSKNSGNHEMCIGAAQSPNLGTAFTPIHTWQMCGPAGHQYIDPYLFVDSSGAVFLFWADQWGAGGGSRILSIQMTSDGLGWLPGAPIREVMNYSRALAASGGVAMGGNAYIENPAVVKDPHNNYNLLVSMGTWNGPNTYWTVEVACLQVDGTCLEGRGGVLNLSGQNAGGASIMNDNTPAGNWLFWHGGPVGARVTWASETVAVNLNNQASSLVASGATVAEAQRSVGPVATNEVVEWPVGDPNFNRSDRDVPRGGRRG